VEICKTIPLIAIKKVKTNKMLYNLIAKTK